MLTLSDIEVRFAPSTTAVSGLSLTVEEGERLVLLGPSGCGKTTTLRVVAGLQVPTRGDVLFDGQSVRSLAPEKRNAAMVFQDHALLPYRTVAQNVGFGLKLRKVAKSDRPAMIEHALNSVRLDGLEERRPAELSGGQRQRVALARALVVQPRILLLDEPLSSLDPELREDLGNTICEAQRRSGITTLMVTHDQNEAVALADRIAVMIDGRLRQVGTAEELTSDPADDDVARFLKPMKSSTVSGADR